MKPAKFHKHSAARLIFSLAVALGAAAAPNASFAAGPGGLALGFGSTVHRMLETGKGNVPFAGVSDPVSFRAADNINTRGFALRRDGAY